MTDNRTTELLREFAESAIRCNQYGTLYADEERIAEYAERIEQAIADELGGRECECVWDEQEGVFRCSSCDTLLTNEISIEWPSHKVTPITLPNYCRNCGKAVRR